MYKRILWKAILYKLGLFWFLICFSNLALGAKVVGKVTAIEGVAEVLRAGKLPAVLLRLNDPIYEKDVLRTKSGAKVEVTLVDGSILRVAQRARVDVSEYLHDEVSRTVLDLKRGIVQTQVNPELSKKIKEDPKRHKFEIKTPVAIAGVRGTDFFVFHERAFTGVLVRTGEVYAYNPRFPEDVVVVRPGQITTISEVKPPAPPRSATEREIKQLERETYLEKRADLISPIQEQARIQAPPPLPDVEQERIPPSPLTSLPPVMPELEVQAQTLTLLPYIALQREQLDFERERVLSNPPPITEINPEVIGLREEPLPPPKEPPPQPEQPPPSPPQPEQPPSPPPPPQPEQPPPPPPQPEQPPSPPPPPPQPEQPPPTGGGPTPPPPPPSPRISNPFAAPLVSFSPQGLTPTGYTLTGSLLLGGNVTSLWSLTNISVIFNATITNATVAPGPFSLIEPTPIIGNGTPLGNGTFKTLLTGYHRQSGTLSYLQPYALGIYLSPNGTIGGLKMTFPEGSSSERRFLINGTLYLHEDEDYKNLGVSASAFLNNLHFGNYSGASPPITRRGSGVISSESSNNTIYYLRYHNGTGYEPFGVLATLHYGNYLGTFSEPNQESSLHVKGRLPFLDSNLRFVGSGTEVWNNGTITGFEEWYMLSPKYLGFYEGEILGTYPSANSTGNYEIASLGFFELFPLKFYAEITPFHTVVFHSSGFLPSRPSALFFLGSISSLWSSTKESPVEVFILGERFGNTTGLTPNEIILFSVRSYNADTGNNTTYDGGAFRGNLVGFTSYHTSGFPSGHILFVGLYRGPNDETGVILTTNTSLNLYFHPLTNSYRSILNLYTVPLGNLTSPEFSFSGFNSTISFASGIGNFSDGTSVSGSLNLTSYGYVVPVFQHITGHSEFGTFNLVLAGNYTGSTNNFWELETNSTTGNPLFLYAKGGAASYHLQGFFYGAFANMEMDNPRTGIVVGQASGFYNSTHWVLPLAGVYLETNKLLNLLGTEEGRLKLRDMYVPAFEVGRVNLHCTSCNSNTGITSLNMNNVIFLAPLGGAKPKIWATGDISGTYSGVSTGTSVPLSGNNGALTATFTLNQWNSGKWSAIIDGSGTLNNHSIHFKGLGAGNYGNGNFTGTGAGYVK